MSGIGGVFSPNLKNFNVLLGDVVGVMFSTPEVPPRVLVNSSSLEAELAAEIGRLNFNIFPCLASNGGIILLI